MLLLLLLYLLLLLVRKLAHGGPLLRLHELLDSLTDFFPGRCRRTRILMQLLHVLSVLLLLLVQKQLVIGRLTGV